MNNTRVGKSVKTKRRGKLPIRKVTELYANRL